MDRAINLGDVVTEEMRSLLGNRNFLSGALAIGGTKTKIKIAAAVDYSIDGQVYHKAITDDLFVHTDVTVQAANTTKWYLLSLDKTGAALITAGPAVLTASVTDLANKTALPKLADTQCVIGAIKVVTAATTFTPATSDHDKAAVTTTYYNLSCVPVAGVPA
jgi:hypothetical protein